MDDKRQRTLQELRRDLQTIQPSDPMVKDRIDRLNDEVNRVINDPHIKDEEEVQSIQRAIQEAIESFEGHHPDLTEALRIAINTLVNAGI
jgi:hypothetical protein